MTIEEALSTILTPVFGDEFYPLVHPDPDGTLGSVANLFGVYAVIGGNSVNGLAGNVNLSRPRIQVSIYSISFADMKAAQKAVDDAMNAANDLANQCVEDKVDTFTVTGALPNVSTTVPIQGFEHETRRYFVHMTYYCWAKS